MNQSVHQCFGRSFEQVERVLDAFRHSHGAIVVDDEDRENEGDLIFASQTLGRVLRVD